MGRTYVTPDDVQYLAPFVFGHRMILRPEAKYEGITAEEIVERILAKVSVPFDKVSLNEGIRKLFVDMGATSFRLAHSIISLRLCDVSRRHMLAGRFFMQYYHLFFILFHCFHIRFELSQAERIIRTPNVENGGKLIVSLTVKRNFPFPLLYTVITEKWRIEELH